MTELQLTLVAIPTRSFLFASCLITSMRACINQEPWYLFRNETKPNKRNAYTQYTYLIYYKSRYKNQNIGFGIVVEVYFP